MHFLIWLFKLLWFLSLFCYRPPPPTAEPSFGDYSEEYDYNHPPTKLHTPGPPRLSPPLCDYDFCQHLQVPCSELRRASGCLCPGVSGPGVAPEPPSLRAIHTTETGASAHWCAPLSTVESYQLRYRPAGGDFVSGPALNSTFRLTAVTGLSPGQEYLFCIVASNWAGSSPTDDGGREHGPCRVGRTPSRQMPYAYVAAGLAAALVLLVVSALAWHFLCRRKKRFPRGARGE
uniref:LRRN4 C-terminal like n=1 Tax=Varanus komodoensis TaxID=61221 RepID=A0A8D2IQ86_VARKO